MATKEPLTIDVISDVMCPWCYIGKVRLDKALARLDGSVEVDIRWRPYQLDATLPKEGRDRQDYLSAKFGGPEGARRAYQAVREAGAAEGIAFDFDAMTVSPNTLDAHRLIRWAASAGADTQARAVDILFRRFFTEGAHIGDDAVLLEVAEEAGMDRAIVEALLKSPADRAEVEDEIGRAQHMGVTGVPCFILAGKYAVMGAQPAETLADAISQVADEQQARHT
jgi:predicted DsbA family dithiol-disulfide isomerase